MYPDLSTFPPEFAAIASETWNLLESGPVPLPEIAAHCREQGLIEAHVPSELDDDIEMIIHVTSLTRGIWRTTSGVLVRLDVLLSNRVFTHRLTAKERSDAAAVLGPDLEIIAADVEEFGLSLSLESGDELHVVFPRPAEDEKPVIAGPAPWLEIADPGKVVAFLKTADGAVDIYPIDILGDGTQEAAAIRAEFDATSAHPEAGYDLFPILIEAIASKPGLFTSPVRPIGDLLETVGLEYRDGMVGPAGTQWRHAAVVFADDLRTKVAEIYGFDMCCHAAFDTVVDAWSRNMEPSQPQPDAVVTVEALAHRDVAHAFTSWVEAMGGDTIDIAAFYEEIGERAGRRGAHALERAAWLWFADGGMGSAIEDAELAIAISPQSEGATLLLGHVAAIQGEYQRALQLLQRSNPDDPWTDILERIFVPYPDARRNDPCPCGSGRKHKVCCAQNPRISAISRMNLLSEKIIEFQQTVTSSKLSQLARVAASAVDGASEPDEADRYMNHPFLIEIAAIEGSLDDFVTLWGPFLPQDERDTVDLWLTATRALWEVTEEPTIPYVTLRDTRTGDTVTVYDETLTPNIHTGDLLLGMVVPAFGEDRFLANPLAIDIRHRTLTLELLNENPTDEDLAHWFGLVTAPPRLKTTEGQDMVICRAVCEPTVAWDAVIVDLDHHFERSDTDNEWVATFVNDAGETVIRGTLAREGSELIIETMSEERFDDILDTLTEVTVVSQTRAPMTVPHPLGEPPRSNLIDDAPLDPEIEEVLSKMMRQREDAWIDEEIPLLGGITPRQAAADPTRRGDLIDLLDSFPPAVGGMAQGYDPDRLRRLLDLDE